MRARTTEEAQEMGDLEPRIRAGDKDRQRVVETLGRHFGEGRLRVDEFDERVARAHAVVYLDELPALTADLPADPVPVRRPAGPPVRAQQVAVALLVAVVLTWSVSAVVYGTPPIFAFVLLFLLLRQRRWSRRW
jgi:hypothetical protein